MIDTANSLRRRHRHIRRRPTTQLKADLSWWAEFLSVFNGTRFFVESEPIDSAEFSTDACPLGAGGFLRGNWFYLNWALDCPALAKSHTNLQETYTVLVALERWKEALRDKWLSVRSDNTTTSSVLNKVTSRNAKAMQWLHIRFWLSAMYNFRVTARYIITDALSRLHDPVHCDKCLHRINTVTAERPLIS